MAEVLSAPLTIEGSSVLHQMFRFDWKRWRKVPAAEQKVIARQATQWLHKIEHDANRDSHCQSALYSQLGHKGDLLMLHFRDSVEALNRVELELARTDFYDLLEVQSSYVSIVELGLYESSTKTYAQLASNGLEAHSPEWNAAVDDVLRRQAEAMAPRLYPAIPDATHLCFYPMDRKRGEQVNWYALPLDQRQKLMRDHSLIGRRYGGKVRQIISGSTGLDDWEWGVDLFADDPLVFKKLIYEMRFDESSALYALFGPFYLGVRLPVEKLDGWLLGEA